MQSLTTDERVVLIQGGRDGQYLATGHLVYGLNGVLFAVPFDLNGRAVIGGPVPLIEGVGEAAPTGAMHFSVAANGSLVYVPGGRNVGADRGLVLVTHSGEVVPTAAPDIGLLTLEGDRTVEMLLETDFDLEAPAVSPDGRWLAYQSNESGESEIYVQPGRIPDFPEQCVGKDGL